MGTIMLKNQVLMDAPSLTPKLPRRLQQMVFGWFSAQIIMKRHWHKYMVTTGNRVPYRVWSRHGAYLEMHRVNRRR